MAWSLCQPWQRIGSMLRVEPPQIRLWIVHDQVSVHKRLRKSSRPGAVGSPATVPYRLGKVTDNSPCWFSVLATRASRDTRALVALTGHLFRVSYVLLRCAAPHGAFSDLSLRSSQFAVSTPFGLCPSVRPRSPPPGEYACVPSFPSRQESARKSPAPPPQTPPAAPA